MWFGQVTPTANSADARVSYNDTWLYVRVSAIDRRLWYDRSPSLDDLVAWDAVTLYLDLDGNLGTTLDASCYRFDGQLTAWEARDSYQASYQGADGDWVLATLPFTTTSGWAGDIPNNDVDDRGSALKFLIPFASLGLPELPPAGTVWAMALVVHDRDDAGGTPIADQVWPEAMDSLQPATWGQVVFGMPTYTPPPAEPGGVLTVRQGLDGAVVPDGMVGGSSVCGAGLDYWTEWGQANYAGVTFSNIQNLGYISEWPCFSRYYVTFPLDTLPPEAVVISATLTLRQTGNAGQGVDPPGPQPSLIQVLTIAEDWDEATLNWNNSPLAMENVSAAWAYPLETPGWPGVPRQWELSRAVAEAHAAGLPLRLALYESDWAFHSGKYFVSSDAGPASELARPTLTVAWGRQFGHLDKSAFPLSGVMGDDIAYTLAFMGSGHTLILTDTLPAGLGVPYDLYVEGTTVQPTYDAEYHRLSWADAVPEGQAVVIGYRAAITTTQRRALVNTGVLNEAGGGSSTDEAIVIANPLRLALPLVESSLR